MRRVLASAALAFLVAARAAVAQAPAVDWAQTAVTGGVALPGAGPDGKTAALRVTASAAASFHLATIDHPQVTAPGYVVSGKVRYEGGALGQGYLEMWSVFPDGGRYFSRAPLQGEGGWRRFALPFSLAGASAMPTSLEINLVLPGPGTVWLGPLSLERPPSGWWSERSGNLVGALLGSSIGLVGALIGLLGGFGRARRLVLFLLWGMVWGGGLLAVVGAFALWSSEPRYVWYPLLMVGGLAAVVGLVVRPAVRRRYAADELRRIAAMDAGTRR